MAISHFIVQLTVTFTHTHTHAECGRGQPSESRVPAKCVVCCLPPPFSPSPSSPHHVASIVQAIAGLRVCELRVSVSALGGPILYGASNWIHSSYAYLVAPPFNRHRPHHCMTLTNYIYCTIYMQLYWVPTVRGMGLIAILCGNKSPWNISNTIGSHCSWFGITKLSCYVEIRSTDQ